MPMRAVWYITLLASALSTSVVFADSCSIDSGFDVGTDGSLPNLSATGAHSSNGHQDLGNGTVLSQQSTWDGHTVTNASNFRMEFCESGRAISVIYKASCLGEQNPFCEQVGLSQPGSFEADSVSIKTTILNMAFSEQEFSLIEFTEVLEGLGAHVRMHGASGHESCGCAAFYPNLIGEKRPHQF